MYVPRRFTWYYLRSTKHPSQPRRPTAVAAAAVAAAAAAVCACTLPEPLVYLIRSHDRRALAALFFLSLGLSPRPLTASYSLTAERRGDCVRGSWLYSFIIDRIDRCSYIRVYLVPRIAAAVPGPVKLHFNLIKDRCLFPILESDGPSCQILAQNLTWAIGFSNNILSRGTLQYRTA